MNFGLPWPYFRASDLMKNMRTLAITWGVFIRCFIERSRAEALIDTSLELRHGLRREYRIGLSLISRAIAHLMF